MSEPDTPETMAQVAAILQARGQAGLAGQILATLPGENPEVRAQALAAEAARAARTGNQEACRSLIGRHEELDLPKEWLIRLFAVILDNLDRPAGKLEREILQRLARLEGRRSLGNLLLARANGKNREQALKYFLEALLAADAEYLESRPDVSEAVKAGGFVSGLQHYALHHRADKTPWPERQFFAKLIQRDPWLPGKAKAGYMRACQFNDSKLCEAMLASVTGSEE